MGPLRSQQEFWKYISLVVQLSIRMRGEQLVSQGIKVVRRASDKRQGNENTQATISYIKELPTNYQQ